MNCAVHGGSCAFQFPDCQPASARLEFSRPVEVMTPPDPANVRLDPRLMTHERLCQLAGYKPVRFTVLDGGAVYVDCAEPGCGKGITAGRVTSGVQLMSDVLRHWVNCHDASLAGGDSGGA